jgi:hypothetical protein
MYSKKFYLRRQSSQNNFILSLQHAKTNRHISIPRSQFRLYGIAALDFQLSFFDLLLKTRAVSGFFYFISDHGFKINS